MLKSLPHNVPVNLRPCGVSFPNDEAVSGDNSQTDAEAGLKRRAEVVQPEFEVFLLLQGDVWVGRFRENFLHEYLTRCHDLGHRECPFMTRPMADFIASIRELR